MSKTNLKKNDEVVVISGSQKGKRGKILDILPPKCRKTKAGRVLPSTDAIRVLIEGVNIVKHHEKKQGNDEAGIHEREAPIGRNKIVLASQYDARSSTPATAQTTA
ncbi:MAG: 50S ribosomal protein L24 [Puniceicoccales bacterium]|jgi:large subunit ribosomal protein L24|nr:50S ribosomal protein L24 [Puniceicoccales bacterium]